MAYLTAAGTNDPMLGAIKIVSTKDAMAPGDATNVKVLRRSKTGATWSSPTTLITIGVTTVNDLSFSFLDRNVLSGQTYRYSLVPVVGEINQSAINVDVACSFDAIFISDTSGTYMASLDIGYKARKNIAVDYVQPLSSKYPHAVRNSNANYFSGNVEGIFVPYTTDGCMPDVANMNAYKDDVIEMLCNGLVKTLRTYDGHGWLVNIDGEPMRDTGQFINSDAILFDWTEVGVFPTTGVVML